MLSENNIKFKVKATDILTRRSKGEKVLYACMFVMLAIYCATMVFAILWIFMSSCKGDIEYAGQTNPLALPEKWRFRNYIDAFRLLKLDDGTTFFGMLWNSIWYTMISSSLGVFVTSITGYCMSKYNFRGKSIIYGVAIFCMTVPIVGSSASYFRLIGRLGVYDTPLYVVVTHLSSWGSSFLIMYAFFKNMSWSFAEAVFIDGGNHFTAFFRVMLPMARGPLFTLFIMSFIGNWNDYGTMILYLPSYQTLASGLYTFQANTARSINYPAYFAGLIISIVPVVAIFAAFSNTIMTNVSIGGLKG